MEQNYDKRTRSIIGTVILCFSIFSILCDSFGTDFVGFVVFSDCFKDASAFLTVVCTAFIIVEILKIQINRGTICIFLLDILLINRLYSNKKWLGIIAKILKWDMKFIFLAIIALVMSIYCIYKIRSKKVNTKGNHEKSDGENNGEDKKRGEINVDADDTLKEKDNSKEKKTSKENVILILKSVTALIVILGVLDYLFYNVLPININKPEILKNISDWLYIGAVISAAIFLVLNYRTGNNGDGNERVSAILALIGEICVIIFSNNFNWGNVSGRFLNVVSDNWFVSVFAFIIFFMVLQIAIRMILKMLFPKHYRDIIGDEFEKSINKIEKKMVKCACDIIEGCVSLLEFVPDFFESVGPLLLGLEQNNDNEDIEKKDDEEIKGGNKDDGNRKKNN